MYVLTSNLQIGNVNFDSVHSVEIERSIHQLGDKATIMIPVTSLLTQAGETSTLVETAKQFKVGDRVIVELGYDKDNKKEFVGYVKSINLRTPIEIVCEDEFYQLRKKSTTLSGKTTLVDIVSKLGLTAGRVEGLSLRNFVCENMTYFEIISKLAQDYGLLMWFDLEGKFNATSIGKVVGETVKYALRENVINDNSLQYRKKEDVKLKVDAICDKKDGTEIKATIGDDGGAYETIYFYNVEDESELKTLAEQELQKRSYDGYDGEIETFLQPYCRPCDIAEITDKTYTDRSGSYLITGVRTTFGSGGGRRNVTIGIKN